MAHIKNIIVVLAILLLLFGQSTFLYAQENSKQLLLTKNTVSTDNSYLKSDEIQGLIQQKPISGFMPGRFRPGIFFYKVGTSGKQNWFKRFLTKTLGTEPIYLDTAMARQTAKTIKTYTENKGFFHSEVTYKEKLFKRTAKVQYIVKAGEPCIVQEIGYKITDTFADSLIISDTSNGKLKTKMIFDSYLLGSERERIADILRNNGYYTISQNDIFYIASLSEDKKKAYFDVQIKKMQYKNPQNDSVYEGNHKRYFIENITIDSDASPENIMNVRPDTLHVDYKISKRDTVSHKVDIIWYDKLKLRPNVLTSILKIHNKRPYSQRLTNNTYKGIIKLPITKSAGITMRPNGHISNDSSFLDCNVRLINNPNKLINIGTEGTNSDGRLGMGINTIFQHRNIFNGAELLTINLKTSAEIQPLNRNVGENNLFLIFNSIEAGLQAGIAFPRILLPLRMVKGIAFKEANSSLNAGFGYEFRPQYKRNLSTLSWVYNWQTSDKFKHTFTPLEVNYINVLNIEEGFKNYLDSLSDPHYKSLFSNHLLTVIRYSLVMSNSYDAKLRNQYYFRATVETSGNTNYLLDKYALKSEKIDNYYKRFGVRYAQYVRNDYDFRRYWQLSSQHSYALRLLAGIAVPYGNSAIVPFEKSFWLGGSNDMRGWKLRSLGPGGYKSVSSTFDHIGDIVLQASVERRFPIYSFLNGGLFIDAGNIWLLKKSEDFPNGEFKLNDFYKQIAVDAGFGIRLNFNFFVVRVDWGIPITNPVSGSKWFDPSAIAFEKINWNIGIGYPF